MKFIFISLLSLFRAHGQCIDKPCTWTTNYPYDAVGEPDTRPTTWGTAGFNDGPIVFQNVPKGYRVRILRLQGNVVARMHGAAQPDNLYAGALFGIITTASAASPYATLAASGCLIYLQLDVNSSHPAHAEFDWDVSAGGLLEKDNTMVVRRAVYLNELPNTPIHIEPSFIVTFSYEKEK